MVLSTKATPSTPATPATTRTVIAEIVRSGNKMICAEGVSDLEAAAIYMRHHEENEQVIEFTEVITNATPPEGAVSLVRVLERKQGIVERSATSGMFGPEPPKMISVDIGPNESMQVPWGRIKPLGIDGYIETTAKVVDECMVFALKAVVKKKSQPFVKELAADIREDVRRASIYKGKAIKVKFRDEEGNLLPLPKMTFMDLSGVRAEDLVFSDDTEVDIGANIFGRIEARKRRIYSDSGVPKKHTVLLGGEPGVGKSMLANVIAQKATHNEVSFIWVESAAEYPEAVKFATRQEEAVILVEDIERIFPAGAERTAEFDRVLNVMDGIDTKGMKLMTIFTTNHFERINQVAGRDGRMNFKLRIEAPDAKAVERLIRNYAGKLLKEGADLTGVSEILAGKSPATVREAVEASKAYAAWLAPDGAAHITLTGEALERGARKKLKENENITGNGKKPKSLLTEFGEAVGSALHVGVSGSVQALQVWGHKDNGQKLTEEIE